jgi:hypothetical protein
MSKILKEPSTAAGIGLIGLGLPNIILGIGQIFKMDHVEPVAAVAGDAVRTLGTGDWLSSLFVVLMGAAAVFKRERDNGKT